MPWCQSPFRMLPSGIIVLRMTTVAIRDIAVQQWQWKNMELGNEKPKRNVFDTELWSNTMKCKAAQT